MLKDLPKHPDGGNVAGVVENLTFHDEKTASALLAKESEDVFCRDRDFHQTEPRLRLRGVEELVADDDATPEIWIAGTHIEGEDPGVGSFVEDALLGRHLSHECHDRRHTLD